MISSPQKSLLESLGSLCARLGHKEFPSGELANLRRLSAGDAPGFSFYKLLLSSGITLPTNDDAERRWTVATAVLASLAGLYSPETSLGAALAEGGLSELRFVRLLRATDRLPDELRAVANILASKGVKADHRQLVRLILITDSKEQENLRRQIARDYYHALHNSTHE